MPADYAAAAVAFIEAPYVYASSPAAARLSCQRLATKYLLITPLSLRHWHYCLFTPSLLLIRRLSYVC